MSKIAIFENPASDLRCSFSLYVRFGRKSNVRSEHNLRSGYLALEFVHICIRGQREAVDSLVYHHWTNILDFMPPQDLVNFL